MHEHNLKTGGLDPTIFNYWYLKSVGIDANSPIMKKARDWIISKGGIESSQTMTKFKLAIFGHFPWSKLWYVPMFIFKKGGLYSYTYMKDITAQWVYPHLTALAYLRYHKTVFNHGADIFELWVNPPASIENDPVEVTEVPHYDILNLVQEMLKLR